MKGNLEGRRRRVIPGADGWKLASAIGEELTELITGSRKLDFRHKIPDIALSGVEAAEMPTYSKGQIWGALRKAWKGYKIAKVQHDTGRMKEYATKIRTLQDQLGVPQASFPDLGV